MAFHQLPRQGEAYAQTVGGQPIGVFALTSGEDLEQARQELGRDANAIVPSYNESTIIHPAYKVYHKNESLSTIYIRVKSSEILYSKNNPQKQFLAKMVMQIHIYDLVDDRTELVSDTVYLFDRGGPDEERYLIGELDIALPTGSKYLAEITFDDLYRMQYVQDVLVIDKVNRYAKENFLIKNEAGEVLFGNAFDPGAKLYVESNTNLPSRLNMMVYDNYDQLPPPPFSNVTDYDPVLKGGKEMIIDTEDRNHFILELGQAGIYFIPDEVNNGPGLTFLVVHSYFPYVKTVSSMVKPMRFITTKQEYEGLVSSENLKKDVDEFWFKVAGNAERASDIIEDYFTRVEIANRYFTSHTQGWKTDRGLIYIIYGQPTSITRNENTENWRYTEKTNVMSAEFNFLKVGNEYSNNDYILNRSTGYKSGWYRSIDSWRQGKVYK